MTLKPWTYEERNPPTDAGVFRLHLLRAQSPRTGAERRISVLEAGDWINVVALTPKNEVVFVRQFRHGTRRFTLEIPGGMVDKGETPDHAAARELREESGYAGDAPMLLGIVAPNPAILNNRCHTYLFENCIRIGEPELDQGEDIEVLTQPLCDVPALISAGSIDHALVICAFWWLSQHRPLVPKPCQDKTGDNGPTLRGSKRPES